MMRYQFALYLGKEKQGVIFSYLVKENFIGILKMEGEFDKEEGKKFLELVYNQIVHQTISPLEKLNDAVNLAIKEVNLPANFSTSIGFLVEDILYLKTINNGAVYIKRDNRIGKILSGDNEASGYIKKDDYFVFSFADFFENIDERDLLKIISKKSPYEIIEGLNSYLKDYHDEGLAGIIIRIFEENNEIKKSFRLPIFEKISRLKKNLNNFYSQKKSVFFAFLIIIIFLLINVSQAFIRSLTNNQLKKEEETKKLIINKLNEAEETAFFNINQSRQLIREAKEQLSGLEKEMGGNNSQKIAEIRKLIEEKEKIIFKKEEKQAEEFYDLTIEAKNAQGSRLYLDGENLVILDKKNGQIFNLNLAKKSIDSFTDTKLKKAAFVASYENNIFFIVLDEGIYQVEKEKVKKIIESHEDWGEIVDFWTYGGNLYLLDKGKDEIYKYLVVDNGFSSKKSYFQPGEAVDLAQVNSMAIDGSIYLGFSDYIIKYLSGVRENFKVSFPEEKINIKKIFTSKDLEKLFAWDKTKSAIYVFSKKGEYEREIKAAIFGRGQDFVVFGQKIYFLLGSKIYSVNL